MSHFVRGKVGEGSSLPNRQRVRVRVIEAPEGMYVHLDTAVAVARALASGESAEVWCDRFELELRRSADKAMEDS